MIEQKIIVKQSSIGFFGLLTIVLIVLKLTNLINWSWLWVFSPIWIPILIILSIIFISVIIYVFSEIEK